MDYTLSGKIIKKGLKSISYDILGIILSKVLTKRRIWDMFDQSEAILMNKKNKKI